MLLSIPPRIPHIYVPFFLIRYLLMGFERMVKVKEELCCHLAIQLFISGGGGGLVTANYDNTQHTTHKSSKQPGKQYFLVFGGV